LALQKSVIVWLTLALIIDVVSRLLALVVKYAACCLGLVIEHSANTLSLLTLLSLLCRLSEYIRGRSLHIITSLS
jgi:hypothetical protein